MKESSVDYARYLADFLHDSFDKLLAHPEFIKMSNTLPKLVAHPFCPCNEDARTMQAIFQRLNRDRLREQFRATARMNVAMDVNMSAYTKVDVMRIAKEVGCKFAFGTDAHSVAGLETIRRANEISELIFITESNLIDLVKE